MKKFIFTLAIVFSSACATSGGGAELVAADTAILPQSGLADEEPNAPAEIEQIDASLRDINRPCDPLMCDPERPTP